MPKTRELAGKKFGKLTVIKLTARVDSHIMWKCKCACGVEKNVSSKNLSEGRVRSCGCLRKDSYENMIGKRSGKLVVESLLHVKKFQRMWKCKCDCGGEKEVPTRLINKGRMKSCGCLKGSPLPYGEAALNALFGQYKRQATKRGYSFNLSKQYFKELAQSTCHYCGITPSNMFKPPFSNGGFIYNGIDRVNNRYGYSKKNCVSCCKFCNYVKRNHSQEEFMAWIERLVVHNRDAEAVPKG